MNRERGTKNSGALAKHLPPGEPRNRASCIRRSHPAGWECAPRQGTDLKNSCVVVFFETGIDFISDRKIPFRYA
ncbi:hypothetical protein [Mastigocoleus sp. MO_188.B34]|uniref:hypothetical protein n=1 Tax=Mastigocoleus sp. MO_188.B34 TaxID=3036635 RepID=UPI002611319D|nr:hypothetical protein [Mastigocoleus sp. MO_188.B34]